MFPLGFAPPQLRPWARTSKEPSSARERPPPQGLFLLPTAALDGPRRYRRRPRSSPMTLPDPTGDAVRFSALRSSAEISVGAANPHRGSSRAKGLRRQACAYSGEVVTKFQSDSSRTDSPVRILYAQPRSRLKPEVRKRKTPSRGLRAASHSWPYACARRPSAARAAPAGRPLLHD